MGFLVSSKDGRSSSTLHGLDVDVVAIVVIEDEHVGVARAGRRDEAFSWIGVDLACGGLADGI